MSRIVLAFALSTALLGGCGGPEGTNGGRTAVASFYPLAWAAEQIGDDGVEVTNLTPAGSEPHDLELSARSVQRLRDADVVLYFGSGFQPAVEQAVDGASGTAVDLLAGGPLVHRDLGEEGTAADPHVWLDPVRFERIAERVGQALHRPAQAARLAARLERLDRDYRRGLEHCTRRELVTSHAAFGYLASRYGLEQIPITGISPEAEPSARQLERVIAQVRAHHATTVFFETLLSPRLAQTVAREAGARTAVLDPLEGLTEEELARGEDYLSVMRRNLATLREALGCR